MSELDEPKFSARKSPVLTSVDKNNNDEDQFKTPDKAYTTQKELEMFYDANEEEQKDEEQQKVDKEQEKRVEKLLKTQAAELLVTPDQVFSVKPRDRGQISSGEEMEVDQGEEKAGQEQTDVVNMSIEKGQQT